VLTGRYGTVDAADVVEYFELLAKAHIIRWQP